MWSVAAGWLQGCKRVANFMKPIETLHRRRHTSYQFSLPFALPWCRLEGAGAVCVWAVGGDCGEREKQKVQGVTVVTQVQRAKEDI